MRKSEKPIEEQRKEVIHVCLNKHEKSEITRVARSKNLNLSAWCRMELLEIVAIIDDIDAYDREQAAMKIPVAPIAST